jgi:hypothetical protein
MPRKRHSAEEIVAKLCQADVLLGQGHTGAVDDRGRSSSSPDPGSAIEGLRQKLSFHH